eukprot:s64_g2.t1
MQCVYFMPMGSQGSNERSDEFNAFARDEGTVSFEQCDHYVVNAIATHPRDLCLATSGIDTTVKIWMPSRSEEAMPVDLANFPWAGGLDANVIRVMFLGIKVKEIIRANKTRRHMAETDVHFMENVFGDFEFPNFDEAAWGKEFEQIARYDTVDEEWKASDIYEALLKEEEQPSGDVPDRKAPTTETVEGEGMTPEEQDRDAALQELFEEANRGGPLGAGPTMDPRRQVASDLAVERAAGEVAAQVAKAKAQATGARMFARRIVRDFM